MAISECFVPEIGTRYLLPEWGAPGNIRALTTMRRGGLSSSPYSSFNLGDHVEDDAEHVASNRLLLSEDIRVPAESIHWLKQVHSTIVVDLDKKDHLTQPIVADGSSTVHSGQVCCIMTADCLPVLLTDIQGTRVAALHAGWRGLCDGVIENGVKMFPRSEDVVAWLGPAIGPGAFEVGSDVFEAFVAKNRDFSEGFISSSAGKDGQKWLADIYFIAEATLRACGVNKISSSKLCTYTNPDKFYSYRRDGVTGRMATLIWKS